MDVSSVRGLDDDVIAAEAVMVERTPTSCRHGRRCDVLDHLLAGADRHVLSFADVELYVVGIAVIDAREGGHVARLRGGRAVFADGASGER